VNELDKRRRDPHPSGPSRAAADGAAPAVKDLPEPPAAEKAGRERFSLVRDEVDIALLFGRALQERGADPNR